MQLKRFRARRGPATPLEKRLAIRIRDRRLLEIALTHRSFAYEKGVVETNERLEFLGDAVLGIVVTDALYREYPTLPEGELAKMRAALVNMTVLADVAREIGIGEAVMLGRGEAMTGGRSKPSILADTLEAILGAIYLDQGIRASSQVILGLFLPRIRGQVEGGTVQDYKTSLQEIAAARLGTMPEYRIEESGPDHAKRFTASVVLAGEPYGAGEGRSKKEAEQAAARVAIARLRGGDEQPTPPGPRPPTSRQRARN